LVAIVVSASLSVAYYRLLRVWLTQCVRRLATHLVLPFAIVHVLFVTLYFAHAIPPVPLSASSMGIFHDVKKVDGGYALTWAGSRRMRSRCPSAAGARRDFAQRRGRTTLKRASGGSRSRLAAVARSAGSTSRSS